MSAPRRGFSLTLAIHPNAHGFGWAAFENGRTPYNWGTIRVRAKEPKNATCLARAERLIERLSPEALVLEGALKRSPSRAGRTAALVRALADLAKSKGVDAASYTREEVHEVFSVVGARTRYEVAQAVQRQFDVFRPLLPKQRRPWDTEREAMAVFSAAALIIVHHRLDSGWLLMSIS